MLTFNCFVLITIKGFTCLVLLKGGDTGLNYNYYFNYIVFFLRKILKQKQFVKQFLITKEKKMKQKSFITIISLSLIFCVFIFAGQALAMGSSPPMVEAIDALDDDDLVDVKKERRYYQFIPEQNIKRVGFIFYPGAMIDARAYAPYARALAEEGYYAFILRLPLDMAIASPYHATYVTDDYDSEVDSWAVGGHSLGGSMAATYADSKDNPEKKIDGLVLLASYPTPLLNNLSDQDTNVASIYATNDGLTSLSDIENSKSRLPSDTNYVEIVGGNHAQFGWYGDQGGDNPADISREEQQAIVIENTLELLDSL